MLQRLTWIFGRSEHNLPYNYPNINYHLIDSEFIAKNTTPYIQGTHFVGPELVIFKEYSERNKTHLIAKCIAQFYINIYQDKIYGRLEDIHSFCETLDHHYPHLEYGSKYYPCVLNQIKQLTWSRLYAITKSV